MYVLPPHTHLAFLRTCSDRRAGKAGKTGEPDSDLRCCWRRSRRCAAGPRILLRGLLATRRLDAFEHAVVLRLQALELQDKLASPARPERASVAYGLGNQGREIRDSGNACVAYNYDTHTQTRTHARKSSLLPNCIDLEDDGVHVRICGRAHPSQRVCACACVFACAGVRACVCVRMLARECVRTHRHARAHAPTAFESRSSMRRRPTDRGPALHHTNAEVTQGEQHMTIYLCMYP